MPTETVTVADVLLDVRDLSPSFDRARHPDAVVMRFLSRFQVELLNKIAQIKPDAVRTTYEIDLPTEDEWREGEPLPDYLLVHGGNVVFTDPTRRPEPLALVEFAERLSDRRWGAYIQGRVIYFLGDWVDWTEVERVDLLYFPRGAALTARESTFELPGQPLPVLVHAAGAFLAGRRPTDPPLDVNGMRVDAGAAEEAYLDDVTGRRRAKVSPIREVW